MSTPNNPHDYELEITGAIDRLSDSARFRAALADLLDGGVSSEVLDRDAMFVGFKVLARYEEEILEKLQADTERLLKDWAKRGGGR